MNLKDLLISVQNGDVDKNEIADHSWKLDHKFDWENKIIIDREQNWRVRKIKETIHSISDKNHINRFHIVFLKYGYRLLKSRTGIDGHFGAILHRS